MAREGLGKESQAQPAGREEEVARQGLSRIWEPASKQDEVVPGPACGGSGRRDQAQPTGRQKEVAPGPGVSKVWELSSGLACRQAEGGGR